METAQEGGVGARVARRNDAEAMGPVGHRRARARRLRREGPGEDPGVVEDGRDHDRHGNAEHHRAGGHHGPNDRNAIDNGAKHDGPADHGPADDGCSHDHAAASPASDGTPHHRSAGLHAASHCSACADQLPERDVHQ